MGQCGLWTALGLDNHFPGSERWIGPSDMHGVKSFSSSTALGMWWVLVGCIAWLAPGVEGALQAVELSQYHSKYYTVYSNLAQEDVQQYARHMDAVFAQYLKRFQSFSTRDSRSMPLYLFRTRDQYKSFLSGHGIDGSASGGMFFVQRGVQGLATWVEDKSKSTTLETLQHEGFHQFAFAYIGPDLPVWVNEGLAEYFGDGILVKKRMTLGLANQRRIESIKAALQDSKTIDFDELLEMTGQQWSQNMRADLTLGRLQYDQSWSIVYFLIHGNRGKYRGAFEDYLMRLNKGRTSAKAFRQAFGTDNTVAFRQKWEQYARKIKPDPLTTAIVKMEFLGQGLRFMQEQQAPIPATLGTLRQYLRGIGFRMIRHYHTGPVEISAHEEELYAYQNRGGATVPFQMLEPEATNLLPRIVARGLKPEPMLLWSVDDQGKLISHIEYR